MAERIRSSNTSVESTLSRTVKSFNAKMNPFYKKKSTTPKVMPPADKTPPIPSSQAAETETPCNERSTTQVAKAAAIVFDKAKVLSYKDLQLLSNDFSPDNYMGWTQFGHLYKGIIPEDWGRMRSGEVTIKMWKYEHFLAEDFIVPDDPYLIRHRMEQEIRFLQQPDIAMHPYTVKVMGYCLEYNNLGVVYDLKPLHTLKKYIDNEKFGWRERVDVAVKLACVLKLFHEHVPQYIVRNLSPAHVMLDQDLNPVLIDYAMIHGGSFVDLLPMQQGGPYGITGYVSVNELCIGGGTTKRNDIHGYGVILLEMLRRCTYGNNRELGYGNISTNEFAWMDYGRYKEKQDEKADGSGDAEEENSLYSFAHKSMRNDPDYEAVDGNKISILALRCVEKVKPNIYSMGAVLKELKALNVVQRELLLK